MSYSGRTSLIQFYSDEEVHLCFLNLSSSEACWGRFWLLLSEAEKERGRRYRFLQHAARFVVVRAALRLLLASILSVPPRQVEIRYGTQGKPFLDPALLQFSVSHSGEWGVIAITRSLAIGVDIEGSLLLPGNVDAIASKYLSAHERKLLFEIPENERASAFLRCWTRKEAYLKATGEGLSRGLDTFSVSIGRQCKLVEVDGDPAKARGWSLVDFTPQPNLAGALALAGSIASVSMHQLTIEALSDALTMAIQNSVG